MLRASVFISIIGYFYNIGVFNYSVIGNNELRLYDFGMLYPSIVFLFLLIKGKRIKFTTCERKFGFFVVYCGLSMLFFTFITNIFAFNIIAILISLLYYYHLLGFFIVSYFAVRIFKVEFLIKIINYLILFSSVVLFLQHIGVVGHFWDQVYIDSYGESNFSGFLGPNRITPSMTMFYGFVFVILTKNIFNNKLISYLTSIFCLANIIMIGSRTTYATFIIFFLYLLFIYRNKNLYFGIFAASFFLILLFRFLPGFSERVTTMVVGRVIDKATVTQRYDTTESRINRVSASRFRTASDYFNKIINSPWVIIYGNGFNNRYIGGASSAHNQYFQLIFELGIPGMLLFVFWIFKLYKANTFNYNNVIYKGFILSIIVSLFAGEHLYIYRPLFALLGLFLLINNIFISNKIIGNFQK